MPNPTWTFNPDGTIVNDTGTVKHFSEILTNHSTSYNANRTLSSNDIFGTINLTGGTAYTLPTSAAIGDQITIVNTHSGDITLTFNGTSTTKISPGGITSFIYVDVNGWRVRSTSKNPVYNPAINDTDPVTLLDMRNSMLANYATQSSITTITSLPATLNTANMGDIIVLNTASSGTLTLYDPRQTINNTYPATLIMNIGSGSVVVSANALNGSFTEQQNTLLTGQYMVVVGGSNGAFMVIDTNNRNPLTNGLLLESGIMNIVGNTALLVGHIGKVIVYGSSYSSDITITLPPTTSVLNGHTAKFTVVNRSSGTITLVCSGSDTIANNSNTLLPNTYKTVVSDSSNTYMVISDNSDLALKNGNSTNVFSAASPTTGVHVVNANRLYSELTGIEWCMSATVTLTNTAKARRVFHFGYPGAQTVILPPLSSRNIAGGGLMLLLKAGITTTLTITTSTSDSFDPGYSNIIYPGEFMVIGYNPGDTYWQVVGGDTTHNSSASNIARKLSLNYGLPQYDSPISYSYSDNTVYYCPVPTRVIAVLSGDHKNNITMYIGSTNNPSHSVGSFGDDIDTNTKEASISADVPGGWYFKLTSSGNDAWETVTVTGYPIQRT